MPYLLIFLYLFPVEFNSSFAYFPQYIVIISVEIINIISASLPEINIPGKLYINADIKPYIGILVSFISEYASSYSQIINDILDIANSNVNTEFVLTSLVTPIIILFVFIMYII